jgi:two-component system, OmpR family, response regulator
VGRCGSFATKPFWPLGSSHRLLVNELDLRIYLVEDNIIIRENLAATLIELTEATVCGSARGENEAIAWFTAHPHDWDIAIVDLFLLQGNGLGVVAALQSRRSAQKVAVLTNYASAAARERCLKLGADVVFDKSHDIDGLISFCNSHSANH